MSILNFLKMNQSGIIIFIHDYSYDNYCYLVSAKKEVSSLVKLNRRKLQNHVTLCSSANLSYACTELMSTTQK